MKYYVLSILLLIGVAFAATTFPQPVGYVNDFANILSNRDSLEQELSAYEKNTTIEIAVVTLDSLPPDQNLFTYGVELFQQWGIGKKGEDNGILVLIVKNGTTGNRLRIELGYGIQGYITGAEAGRILDDAMPYYTAGAYDAAAETIIVGLRAQLVNYVPGQPNNELSTMDVIVHILPSLLPFGFFIIIMIISVAMRNRCPYCRGPITCTGDYCVCKKCKRKFKRQKRYAPFLVAGGFGGGGGGGGFGGFGGGASGGGGAGR